MLYRLGAGTQGKRRFNIGDNDFIPHAHVTLDNKPHEQLLTSGFCHQWERLELILGSNESVVVMNIYLSAPTPIVPSSVMETRHLDEHPTFSLLQYNAVMCAKLTDFCK